MVTFAAAADALARVHPVAASLAERHGPPRLGPVPAASQRFAVLARSIAFQQLAGAAATTIWRRVGEALGGEVTPDAILAADPRDLAAAGLSRAKVAALVDLARHAHEGRLGLERIGRLDDAAVVQRLVAVRGIGEWTAQMFLLFALRRLDVWPTGDLGVRRGFARAFGLDEAPDARTLGELGEPFAPYRSVLAWYCWREADTITPAG